MVRSAHLALFPIRLADQFDFTVSDRFSCEKIHTASLGTATWTDLSTCNKIKVTCAEMSPYRLPSDAVCIIIISSGISRLWRDKCLCVIWHLFRFNSASQATAQHWNSTETIISVCCTAFNITMNYTCWVLRLENDKLAENDKQSLPCFR